LQKKKELNHGGKKKAFDPSREVCDEGAAAANNNISTSSSFIACLTTRIASYFCLGQEVYLKIHFTIGELLLCKNVSSAMNRGKVGYVFFILKTHFFTSKQAFQRASPVVKMYSNLIT